MIKKSQASFLDWEILSPVSELGAQAEVVSEEVFLRRYGPLQPEKSVVFHAGLPQVLTRPVVDHIEAQQGLPGFRLHAEEKTSVYEWLEGQTD